MTVALGIALLIAAAGWGAFAYFRPVPPASEAIRFSFSPPENWKLATAADGVGGSQIPLAVSPDGKRVAFAAAGAGGKWSLWVRSLETLTATSLAGTEGAMRPFWSPDNRYLAFFADGKLKKIDVSGGPPIILCDVPAERGGTWSQDGVIVFAPSGTGALQKVSASGGVPTAATTVAEGEGGHSQPYFLPDGRHFLYYAASPAAGAEDALHLGSLDSAEGKLLLNADAYNVAYSEGHLLFLRKNTLMAQPFDLKKLALTGETFPIAEGIQTSASTNYGYFSASQNGVLAYVTGAGAGGSQLMWLDRTGRQVGVLGDASGLNNDVQLSPDGKQAAVSLVDEAKKTSDIWMYDVARNLKTRFTFDPAGEISLIWSADGKRVVFTSNRKGHFDLYQKAADGSGMEELLFADDLDKYPMSFTPDGKFLLYVTAGGPTRDDLFVLPISASSAGTLQAGKPAPFVNSPSDEVPGYFSPDGRWVVYLSSESGRGEIYVAPFPGPGGKRQISAAGGLAPRWSHDGTEIFYLAPDNKLMAATVNGKGTNFEVGAVKPLFQTNRGGPRNWFDVSADGRFLINAVPEPASDAPITIVVNWLAGVKR